MEETTITRLDKGTKIKQTRKIQMPQEQLIADCHYQMAQKMSRALLENGLISRDEFHRITVKNRESFKPYLSEIMPELS